MGLGLGAVTPSSLSSPPNLKLVWGLGLPPLPPPPSPIPPSPWVSLFFLFLFFCHFSQNFGWFEFGEEGYYLSPPSPSPRPKTIGGILFLDDIKDQQCCFQCFHFSGSPEATSACLRAVSKSLLSHTTQRMEPHRARLFVERSVAGKRRKRGPASKSAD